MPGEGYFLLPFNRNISTLKMSFVSEDSDLRFFKGMSVECTSGKRDDTDKPVNGEYMKPKVVCLVGHENWGKSEMLYYLVEESYHRAWIQINNVDIFIRHMSNDDQPDSFINFINFS